MAGCRSLLLRRMQKEAQQVEPPQELQTLGPLGRILLGMSEAVVQSVSGSDSLEAISLSPLHLVPPLVRDDWLTKWQVTNWATAAAPPPG